MSGDLGDAIASAGFAMAGILAAIGPGAGGGRSWSDEVTGFR